MSYYERYYQMYLNASPELRKQSLEHWTKCHKENLRSGRNDLIIFSAQILAQITLAENNLSYKRFNYLRHLAVKLDRVVNYNNMVYEDSRLENYTALTSPDYKEYCKSAIDWLLLDLEYSEDFDYICACMSAISDLKKLIRGE